MPELNLAGSIICVVGPERRQNELMSSFLERVSEAECQTGDSNYQIPECTPENGSHTRLILWDCNGTGEESLLKFESNYYAESARDIVAFLNVQPDIGIEEGAIDLGIKGFFYETDPPDRMPKGLMAILNGELWVSRKKLSDYIMSKNKYRSNFSGKALGLFSRREIETLRLLTIGASNQEIADILCISRRTVKSHVYNIYKKMNVPNRLQAILWARKKL